MSKIKLLKKKIGIIDKNGNITDEKILVPKNKGNRLLCEILLENHGSVWMYVNRKKDEFRYRSNTYFIRPEGIYISENRILKSTYMEGISTPLTHDNIEKETVERSYIDPNGVEVKQNITQIKGLKYDSAVIDMLLNRKLADEFTRVQLDLPNLIMIILLAGTLITSVISCVVSYVRV